MEEITNENNFDPVVQEEDEEFNYFPVNRQLNMKSFTKNNNVRNAGRQPACNVVEGPIGTLGAAKNGTTPIETWGFFIKGEILKKSVTNTNERIEGFRNRFQETLEFSSKCTYCQSNRSD